jgi:hypothetical protein
MPNGSYEPRAKGYGRESKKFIVEVERSITRAAKHCRSVATRECRALRVEG